MSKAKTTSSKRNATIPTAGSRAAEWQGMNWIRQEKRLAIYLRDGMACCYCGCGVEDGAQMTLDHLVPHSKGGSNNEVNLVTCCQRCNSARGARPLAGWIKAVAAYRNHGATAATVAKHVRNCAARSLNPHKVEALELIARRGSAAKALAAF